MKNIFAIIFIFILVLSCESANNPNTKNGEITPNPDPSLIGRWQGSTHGKYLNSIREYLNIIIIILMSSKKIIEFGIILQKENMELG